jgi:hypothetical protein
LWFIVTARAPGALPSVLFANPVADPLAALEWQLASSDHLRQINEDVGSAVIRGDEPETLVMVEPVDDPKLDRAHGLQHRVDVEVLVDSHR